MTAAGILRTQLPCCAKQVVHLPLMRHAIHVAKRTFRHCGGDWQAVIKPHESPLGDLLVHEIDWVCVMGATRTAR